MWLPGMEGRGLKHSHVRRETLNVMVAPRAWIETRMKLQTECHLLIDMFRTCKYAESMSKMIQIRNVPDYLHKKLKARAAIEGMSLSDYLMAEIRRSAETPTLKELRERLSKRTPVIPRVPPAEAVRHERDLQ